MKRFLILSILMPLSMGVAHAQYEKAVRVSSDTVSTLLTQEVSKGYSPESVYTIGEPRDKYNWFVEVSGGGSVYCAELNRTANNFITRMRPSVQWAIGKWIAPAWAVRFASGFSRFRGDYYLFGEWNMYDNTDHSVAPQMALDACYTDEAGNSWFRRKFNVLDADIELIYDVNRLFTKRKTPFDILLYGGIGYSYAFHSQGVSHNGSINFKGGLDVHYNIAKCCYLKTVIEGTLADESLDGQLNGWNGKRQRTMEGYLQAMVGVGFNWGGYKKHQRTYTIPYTTKVNKTYITKENVVKDDMKAPFVVRFYIDQYNVEPDQELNIAKVCKYMQEHPNAKMLMTGHCDPETATPAYNQALSERRCNSVLKYIDDHYGIDHSRIEVKPMGDTERNFNEDFRWNRCVILRIIEK